MLGEESERLQVEDEGRGVRFAHSVRHLRGRQGVVGAIDFDQGEVRRVVAKPRLGGVRLLGIEQPGVEQRFVRPGGGANENVAHASTLWTLRAGRHPPLLYPFDCLLLGELLRSLNMTEHPPHW